MNKKFGIGLPALLLGTSLLAGAAWADDHPHFGHHTSQGDAHSGGPRTTTGSPAQAGGGAPQQSGEVQQSSRPGFVPRNSHDNHSDGFNSSWRQDHRNWQGHSAGNQFRWNFSAHDRNVAHFDPQARSTWTHGQWRHGHHHGHNGWWWYTGGSWFFYDQPVYPYPGYASDYYYSDDDGYGDQGYDGGAYYGGDSYNGPGGGDYSWYYCSNPAGYYPYVKSCRGPWQRVAPTPGAQQGPSSGPDANDDDNYGPQDQDRGPQADDDRGGPPPGYGNAHQRNFDNGPPPDDQQGDDENDGTPPPPRQ